MKSSKPVRLYAIYFISLLFVVVYTVPALPFLFQPDKQGVTRLEQVSAILEPAGRIPDIPAPSVPSATALPDTARQPEQVAINGYKANNKSFVTDLPGLDSQDLRELIAEVRNGQKDVVRGVYVPDVLSLPVIQQPDGDATFVSQDLGVVTQFRSASRNGVTGFLAHNFLSGQLFYKLKVGQKVSVIYGDGRVQNHEITDIQRFQKLSPDSMQSLYRDLSNDEILTTAQVFARFYRGPHKAVFQTCLEKDGSLSWGLVFIVAEPLDK